MSRLRISWPAIMVGLFLGLPRVVIGQVDRFEGPPIVDFPLTTPESSEVVPDSEVSPVDDDVRAPSRLPVSRESLDTSSDPKVDSRQGLAEKPSFSDESPSDGSGHGDAASADGSPLENAATPRPSTTSRPTAPGSLPPPPPSYDPTRPLAGPRRLDRGTVSSSGDAVVLPQEGPYQAYPGETLEADGVVSADEATWFGDQFSWTGLLSPNIRAYGGGWDIGGWMSSGVTVNANGNDKSTGNAPLGFNNAADGFVVNQAWLYVAKETQTHGFGWDWGFRFDFLFGADAPDTQAFGDGSWDASWDTGGEYGFAMPQIYGEIAYNHTKTKVGRFFTNIGYEQVAAPYNFFYSHSLSRYYNQPSTHTGFLTQFDLRPNFVLFGGWTAGWDAGFDNRKNGSAFLGGAVWHVSDQLDLMYATSAGDPGDARSRGSNVYMHSFISDVKFGYGWNYVFEWDYQRLDSGGTETTTNGLNQYLFKQLYHDTTVGLRFEYFRDGSGARIGEGKGNYYGLTIGGNWRPFTQMVVRPEIRWDWFEGQGRPYNDNHSRSQFTFGMDAVYVF